MFVDSPSDFPTASGGFHTLAANTTYVVSGTVTITDGIKPSVGSSIVSLEAASNELNYTGTATMFVGAQVGLNVDNISIRCANGTLQSWIDTSPLKTSVVEYTFVHFLEIKHIGLTTDIKQLRYFACVMDDIKVTGHTFGGDIEQVFAGACDFVVNGATPVFDLGTATFDLMWVTDYQAKLVNASSKFVKGLAGSANINTGGTGVLNTGLHLGAGTPLDTITVDDIQWVFSGNEGIADTKPDALTFLLNNATETAIATVNTPVTIAGTFTTHRVSHFTATAGGRITYIGDKPLVVPIAATITAKTASGADKDVTFYVAKNGSIVANSGISNNVKLANKNNTVMFWQDSLVKNDYLEIWVENNDDTVNIIVEDMNFIVN